jgi:hypothetical protein
MYVIPLHILFVLVLEEKYQKGTGIVAVVDPVWQGILMHKHRIEWLIAVLVCLADLYRVGCPRYHHH